MQEGQGTKLQEVPQEDRRPRGRPDPRAWEDRWETALGAIRPGQGAVLRGRDLLAELGREPWMGLYLYALTGRRLPPPALRLLEGIWVLCCSYPDPRLWNNRIAALAGNARAPGGLALGAALGASEGRLYGAVPAAEALAMLQALHRREAAGEALEALVEEALRRDRRLPGYGRPVVRHDERVAPLLALARELGLDGGPHLALALRLEGLPALRRRRLRINVAAVAAGLAADLGLDAEAFHLYLLPCFTAGIVACYADARAHPEGSFLPLRCDRVHYTGPPPRRWEAEAEGEA